MGVPHSPQNLRPSGLSASGIISLAARAVQACALLHSSVSGRGRGLGTPARTLETPVFNAVSLLRTWPCVKRKAPGDARY